jgi:hypothetical protein
LLRGGDLQPAAHGAAGGGLKHRREPGGKPDANGTVAFRQPIGRIPAPVGTAVTAVPTPISENFTHEKFQSENSPCFNKLLGIKSPPAGFLVKP